MGMLCGLHHYNHVGDVFDLEAIVSVAEAGGPYNSSGFIDQPAPNMGSISDPMIIGGEPCLGIYSTGSYDFNVLYESDFHEQDAWTTIFVEDGDGILRQYNSADADNFIQSPGGNVTLWGFGFGAADRVYDSGDDGEDHPVGIIL